MNAKMLLEHLTICRESIGSRALDAATAFLSACGDHTPEQVRAGLALCEYLDPRGIDPDHRELVALLDAYKAAKKEQE